MIDLTKAELLKDLTLLDLEIGVYDLHNEYECSLISLTPTENSLSILFESDIAGKEKVCFQFKEVRVAKFELFPKQLSDRNTINTIYRGRFESEGQVHEHSNLGESYFYIEFEQGDSIEFFSKRLVFLQL